MKNKKNIGFIIGLIVVFLIVVMVVARPRENTSAVNYSSETSGEVQDSASLFDFGTISMARGKVDYTFALKNTTAEEVSLNSIYTSCMCTVAFLEKNNKTFGPFEMPGHGVTKKINETLASGEEVGVKVVFDPAAHGPAGVGPIERTVVVQGEGSEPFAVFTIRAVVTP